MCEIMEIFLIRFRALSCSCPMLSMGNAVVLQAALFSYSLNAMSLFRWFMKSQHISPAEAVKIHQKIAAKKSIGIHWGTYEMGGNEVSFIVL